MSVWGTASYKLGDLVWGMCIYIRVCVRFFYSNKKPQYAGIIKQTLVGPSKWPLFVRCEEFAQFAIRVSTTTTVATTITTSTATAATSTTTTTTTTITTTTTTAAAAATTTTTTTTTMAASVVV